ncbi:AbiV family abortive infection protein [Saccharopolyspora sp. NPDC002686]|uniref:AbiV family abortive infection protein n=1 Tax=Saccharopolyspora sp. NPDC002686 TaxID=3154541 RepID=UPI003318B007
MPKGARRLTRPQLTALAQAALDNAVELLDDARILLAMQRWPRACSLAILAAEEYGKFYLSVVTALQLETATKETWTKFWKEFGGHQPKYTNLVEQFVDGQEWGPAGGPGDAEWLIAWNSRSGRAADSDKLKQMGFYVDVDRGTGAVLTPAQSIDEDIAIQQVELVESVVRQQATLFSDGLTFLATPPPQLEGFWAEAKALQAAGAPSRADAMALWEKYFGDITGATTDQIDSD